MVMLTSSLTVYTVGCDLWTMDRFVNALRIRAISTLVDVRRDPRSEDYSANFTEVLLRPILEKSDIVYHLGGRHLGERQGVVSTVHRGLPTPALQAYAHHMETELFATGLQLLLNVAGKSPTAIMGMAETHLCHRLLIADVLTLRGHQVLHISADGQDDQPHVLHPALRRESWTAVYDCPVHHPTST